MMTNDDAQITDELVQITDKLTRFLSDKSASSKKRMHDTPGDDTDSDLSNLHVIVSLNEPTRSIVEEWQKYVRALMLLIDRNQCPAPRDALNIAIILHDRGLYVQEADFLEAYSKKFHEVATTLEKIPTRAAEARALALKKAGTAHGKAPGQALINFLQGTGLAEIDIHRPEDRGRNVRHVRNSGAAVFNPWEDKPPDLS